MKTLEEFEMVKAFLESQGSTPSPVAMVALDASAWEDVKFLAREWKNERAETEAARQLEIDSMTDEEKAQRERDAQEEAQREQDEVTFHSCGSRPRR